MARQHKILVADDDAMVRMVMRAVLAYKGYQVEEAGDGEEAIRKYEEACHSIDLVMMDLNMPVLNGRDALSRLLEFDPAMKAVLLTGGVQQEEDLSPMGQVRYMQKPFVNDELVRVVGEMLSPA
jgi:response regulator NasT